MTRTRITASALALGLLLPAPAPAQQTRPATQQTPPTAPVLQTPPAVPTRPAATQSQPGATPEELLQRGAEALAAGDAPAAVAALEPVVKAQPRNLTAVLTLADAYLAAQQLYPALETYNRAKQLSPLDWRIEFGLGTVYLRQGYFRVARPFLERAVSLAPAREHPRVLYSLAATLRGLYRTQEAIDVVRQILTMDSENLEARRLLIALYIESNRLDDALAEDRSVLAMLRRQLAAKPDDLKAVTNLTQFMSIQTDLLQRQIAVKPQDPNLRLQLADAAEQFTLANQQMVYHEALRQLEEALRLAPDNPDVLYACGRLQYLVGRPALAAENLRKALQIAPEHAQARQLLERVEAQAASRPAS